MITDKVGSPAGRFSIRSRLKSFSHAWSGVIYFFRTEHNARVHLAATMIVIAMCLLLRVERSEALILLFAITLVWITEMLNTAIEKAMDFITTDQHKSIKIIKDISAAAVLVSSLAAFIAGAVIFIPKLIAV